MRSEYEARYSSGSIGDVESRLGDRLSTDSIQSTDSNSPLISYKLSEQHNSLARLTTTAKLENPALSEGKKWSWLRTIIQRKEKPKLNEHFSPESRKWLEDNGYSTIIVEPKSLKELGVEVSFSKFFKGTFIRLQSYHDRPMKGEVAYLPNNPLITDDKLSELNRSDIKLCPMHPSVAGQIQTKEGGEFLSTDVYYNTGFRTTAGTSYVIIRGEGDGVKLSESKKSQLNKHPVIKVVRPVRPA